MRKGERVVDRDLHAVASCPKCVVGQADMVGLVMTCRNCGYKYDPDERAFMKMRNLPRGLETKSTKLKVGRPKRKVSETQYNENQELIENILMGYRGEIFMKRLGEMFDVSESTVARIVHKHYGNHE